MITKLYAKMDLDGMIQTAFWKDILYEIISTMDPWDIDITELAARYSKKVEEMKEMNFRIPANVVIVSSVLLRMKADLISSKSIDTSEFYPECSEEELMLDEFGYPLETESKPRYHKGNDRLVPIAIKPKRILKRRVTAMELIAAIQEVLEDKVIKKKMKEKNGENKDLVISLDRDIKELIKETYERIMDILSRKEVVLFSELGKGKEEVISVLIPLLHLSNEEKIKLTQEKIFDEIYIQQP